MYFWPLTVEGRQILLLGLGSRVLAQKQVERPSGVQDKQQEACAQSHLSCWASSAAALLSHGRRLGAGRSGTVGRRRGAGRSGTVAWIHLEMKLCNWPLDGELTPPSCSVWPLQLLEYSLLFQTHFAI